MSLCLNHGLSQCGCLILLYLGLPNTRSRTPRSSGRSLRKYTRNSWRRPDSPFQNTSGEDIVSELRCAALTRLNREKSRWRTHDFLVAIPLIEKDDARARGGTTLNVVIGSTWDVWERTRGLRLKVHNHLKVELYPWTRGILGHIRSGLRTIVQTLSHKLSGTLESQLGAMGVYDKTLDGR